MDFSQKVIKYGKCCATERPLKGCKYVNMVQLEYFASWPYPTIGNIITGTRGRAVAYVHDDVMSDQGKVLQPVKFAVELKDGQFIYHPVSELTPVPSSFPPPNKPPDLKCGLAMYTIYDKPSDFPRNAVVKKWVVGQGTYMQDPDFFILATNAQEAADKLLAKMPDLFLLPPDHTDEPQIVGTYI